MRNFLCRCGRKPIGFFAGWALATTWVVYMLACWFATGWLLKAIWSFQ